MDMKVLCECNSWNCDLVVPISYEENLAIHQSGQLVISESCETGPDSTDVFVEKRNGYSIYKDS